ncbi:MAG: FMN-dependent NADH-azoreductase [Alphaproteobacteria bacterium]|nr:FMN-dependent NADH-azoreductase [Rhodospirillales bacterium]MCW9044910.1 FMN-dependent NADH-azoreductase [Alphaproteobacteria bacterium]
MNILVINSSPMGEASISRQLVKKLVDEQLTKNLDAKVIERDVMTNQLPHLDASLLGAFFTPDDNRTVEQQQAVQQSDNLIDELFSADIIVFGIPMHNFGIPSALKAYIDQISRAGKTFKYTETGAEGFITGKKVYVVSSRGGDYSENSPMATLDFINPYMKTVLGFMGMTDVSFIGANGVNMGDEAKEKAVAVAEKQIEIALAA